MLGLPPLPTKYKGVAFVGVLSLAAVLVSAIYGGRGWMQLRELRAKQSEIEALALQLQRENEARQAHLQQLANDDSYLEKLVRERLGWIKPGETVYRARGVGASTDVPVSPDAVSSPSSSNAGESSRGNAVGGRSARGGSRAIPKQTHGAIEARPDPSHDAVRRKSRDQGVGPREG